MTQGQFGSLADIMEHNNNDHTGWIAANVQLNPRFSFYGQAILTEGSSSFSDLHLDASGLEGIPNGFNYQDVSELGDFSHLRIRWWTLQAGLRQQIGPRMLLEYGVSFEDYQDSQPFLADTSGSNLGALFRLNWLLNN